MRWSEQSSASLRRNLPPGGSGVIYYLIVMSNYLIVAFVEVFATTDITLANQTLLVSLLKFIALKLTVHFLWS